MRCRGPARRFVLVASGTCFVGYLRLVGYCLFEFCTFGIGHAEFVVADPAHFAELGLGVDHFCSDLCVSEDPLALVDDCAWTELLGAAR